MFGSAPLSLRPGDRERLEATIEDNADAELTLRARILLLASERLSNSDIARRLNCSRRTVQAWRARYRREGIPGLRTRPRSGRPTSLSDTAVLLPTLLRDPDTKTRNTQWSARGLATHLRISPHSVLRVWSRWELQSGERRIPLHPTMRPDIEVLGAYLSNDLQCLIVASTTLRADSILSSSEGASPTKVSVVPPSDHSDAVDDKWRDLIRRTVANARRQDHWVMPGQRNELLTLLESSRRQVESPIHVVWSVLPSWDIPLTNQTTFHVPPPTVTWFGVMELLCAIDLAKSNHPDPAAAASALRTELAAAFREWGTSSPPVSWASFTSVNDSSSRLR